MSHLKTAPAVCAVGNQYQIIVPVDADSVMGVEIPGAPRRYFDHCNGVKRSRTRLHRVTVPMEELDRAGTYTLVWRKIIDRKPYFPELEPEGSATFSFRPLPTTGEIKIYHIADVHNGDEPALKAGAFFGKDLDLLVLNGDIPDSSGSPENFNTIYALCGGLTGGEIPVVFARGNHDLRGIYAESMTDYIPCQEGRTYFTFRLGRIWGMVLDCAEDKRDTNAEYGGTICCHEFREGETDFIKNVIADAAREYDAPGIEYKLIVSHMPFANRPGAPFDIEEEIYTEWCRLLRENVKPDLMLAGHEHILYVGRPGCDMDHRGAPCPFIIGARPGRGEFAGAALVLKDREAYVRFTDQDGKILGEDTVSL